MTFFNDIKYNYYTILNSINDLKTLLISELSPYVSVNASMSFEELIHKINDIPSLTYDIPGNARPSNITPTITPPIVNNQYNSNTNLTKYNVELYERIKYYMLWIRYYVVLKGAPIYIVNQAKTLKDFILLIQYIDTVETPTLTVSNLSASNNIYAGTPYDIEYTITDAWNRNIKEGNIVIEENNTIIFSTHAGSELSIEPTTIGQHTYKIYYTGTKKYTDTAPQTFTINVQPTQIHINMSIQNTNSNSRYYQNTGAGYYDDTWALSIQTLTPDDTVLPNIPITIDIGDGQTFNGTTDSNGEYSVSNFHIHRYNSDNNNESVDITCTSHMTNTNSFSNKTEICDVDIYHYPFKTDSVTEYLGREKYEFIAIIVDELTGEDYDKTYDGQKVTASLLNYSQECTIINGVATFKYPDLLTIGNYTITWTLDIPTEVPNENEPEETPGNDEGEDEEISSGDEYDDGGEIDDQTDGYNAIDENPIDDNISNDIEIVYITLTHTSNVTIISNFILPEQTSYFLGDTPTIYYKPFNTSSSNNHVLQTYTFEPNPVPSLGDKDSPIPALNAQQPTDSSGKVLFVEQLQNVGTYTLTLVANSHNLNETVTFTYTLRKPFKIELDEYNTNSNVKYKITIYDTTHYQWDNHSNYIHIVNESGRVLNTDHYLISTDTSNGVCTVYINTIYSTDTVGSNDLTVDINGYALTTTFVLGDSGHKYRLTTDSVPLGTQTIYVANLDNNTNTLTVTGDGVTQQSCTLNHNIYAVTCIFTKAGTKTLNFSDGSTTETDILIVEKGDYNLTATFPIELYVNDINNKGTLSRINTTLYNTTSVNIVVSLRDMNNNVVGTPISKNVSISSLPIVLSKNESGDTLSKNIYTLLSSTISHLTKNTSYILELNITSNENYDTQTISKSFLLHRLSSNLSISSISSGYKE